MDGQRCKMPVTSLLVLGFYRVFCSKLPPAVSAYSEKKKNGKKKQPKITSPHESTGHFVEAAHRCTFASRLSHSCAPNCHTVNVSVGGKLTIAQYTTRHVACGEELCWNYSCVTESEKEYRAAICLCSSMTCKGAFLDYAGSSTFTTVGRKVREGGF